MDKENVGKYKDSSVKLNDQSTTDTSSPGINSFPVVGIGASAGGLEALQSFFHAMPSQSGIAFVVVTHQLPGHESLLPELLARETNMPFLQIEDGTTVKPDHVYVLGSGSNLIIRAGILQLVEVEKTRSLNLPIDIFFRSLAMDLHERAIGVILSGTGSDGTLGIKEIKAQGGIVIAQEPSSAKYQSMPENARNTDMVDFVVPPEKMPERLINFVNGTYLSGTTSGQNTTSDFLEEDFTEILKLLRKRVGHDFSSYKQSTIRRRIERRMGINDLKHPKEYLQYLHENRQEAQMLFSELLISVTRFFRDPEAFAVLHDKVLPDLIKSRLDNHDLRVWIPGCATGEEAFSIAIILNECISAMNKMVTVKIFGTDLDDQAILRARHGAYPSSIAIDIAPERLDRFFVREGEDSFIVRKDIRDTLVFAPQNVLSDPPFTKIDLLICRNVLIYLQSDLQQQLLPVFHFALNPGGILFLGSSESVGPTNELFEIVDAKWKIYRRREVPTELPHLPAKPSIIDRAIPPILETKNLLKQPQTNHLIERFLIKRFAPVSIVIDRQGFIIYIHGRSGIYLEPEQQQPRNDIMEMAREGLRLPLSSAIHQAVAQDQEVFRKDLNVKTNGEYTSVNICVSPIKEPEPLRGLLLVSISPAKDDLATTIDSNQKEPGENSPPPEHIEELDRELQYLKESHQSTIEELQSTNEELQSSNEELQSTNEELQSSKEEMESLNEELTTVNNELGAKVQALGLARDDMKNLLNSIDIAVIFLDQQMRVKRYTEKTRGLISLRESDVGRPIGELSIRVSYNNFIDDCREVLDTLIRKEKELLTQDGTCFLMRILPYRTAEDVIGGVVITFTDITRIKEAEHFVQAMQDFESVVQTMREPLLVLDGKMEIYMANDSFYGTFQTTPKETIGKLIFDLGNRQWNIPALRKLLGEILPSDATITDFQVAHDFPSIGVKKFILNARRLKRAKDQPGLILLAFEVRQA